MDADKLFLRSVTVVDGMPIYPSHGNGGIANDLMLGRCRWTAGASVLAQPDCEAGALQIQPVDRLIRTFRIPGVDTEDDAARFALSTPHRATWHHADHAGLPPLDLRVCKGDLFVRDTGNAGEDRFLMAATHADGVPSSPTFYGLAMLAQYRTAATLGAKTQHSDRSTWRASSWGGSALNRDFRARSYVRSAADASDIWEWRLSRLAAGGTERDVVRVTSDGELRVQGPGGGQPALLLLDSDLDNVHATSQVGGISCTSFAPDQAQMVLVHGTAARRLSWQFRCPTEGFVGLDALAVQLSPSIPADEGAPYLASPTAALTASYLAEGGVTGATWWWQHQLDSADPTGRLRFANTYGDGVLDLHSYGRLALAGTTVLAGDLAAGNAGAFTSTPTYDGAHAVATHALLEFNGPTLSGGASLGDAVLARYDASPGTHKGLDVAAGGADAWEKRETPAGLLYGPLFTSKAVAATRIGSSAVALYAKTLSGGSASWDVAGDGFASVVGVVATVKSTGGGGGGGPQVVADASDPQALAGVGGTEDYALALIDGGGVGIAVFFPSSMTVSDLATLFGISTGAFDFASNDGSFTSSPGPVFVNGGAGSDYTWDNTALDDSTVGSISTSPGNPTLEWNGSAYEATYAEWTLGATTYENTATGGPPTVDSYFFLAAGGGGGGGGGIPALGWSVDGTTVTVTDGSGSSSDDVSAVVWGVPS